MIIKFTKVAEGKFNATNITNGFNAYIDQDLLGEFYASYESDDLTIADEAGFQTFEQAANWLNRREEFVLTTTFGA